MMCNLACVLHVRAGSEINTLVLLWPLSVKAAVPAKVTARSSGFTDQPVPASVCKHSAKV